MKNHSKCYRTHWALFLLFMILVPLGASAQILGDVDTNGNVNIVDALLVAQAYVGLLDTGQFDSAMGDVDGSGNITIIDALLIAQYYVGIIDSFPGEVPTPTEEEVIAAIQSAKSFETELDSRYRQLEDADINGVLLQVLTTIEDLDRATRQAESKVDKIEAAFSGIKAYELAQQTSSKEGTFTIGNLVKNYMDLYISHLNDDISIYRKYDSNNHSTHSFGKGWTFNYDTRIIMGASKGIAEMALIIPDVIASLPADYDAINGDFVELYDTAAMVTVRLQALNDLSVEALAETQKALTLARALENQELIQQSSALHVKYQEMKDFSSTGKEVWEEIPEQLQAAKTNCEQTVSDGKQALSGLLEGCESEIALAEVNEKKNQYVVNNTDPDHIRYCGNHTITLINGSGEKSIFSIDAKPDTDSTVTHADGHVNYYPQGSTTTALGFSTDKLTLMPDGSYRLIRKNRSVYIYDYYGQLQQIKDNNANAIDFSYTDHLLTGITDGFGREIQIERTGGRITKITDPMQRSCNYLYDENGFLTACTDVMERRTSFEYLDGLLSKINTPGSVDPLYTYTVANENKVLASVSHGKNNTEYFRYFPDQQCYEHETASGIIEKYFYNDDFQIIKNKHSDGTASSVTYNKNGFLLSQTNEMGQITYFSYDDKNNLLSREEPGNIIERWSYDDLGQVISHTDSDNNSTHYRYDTNGNLLKKIYHDNTEESWTYNGWGLPTIQTDSMGNNIHFNYDHYGYLSEVRDQEGLSEFYVNDTFGNVMSHTDTAGKIRTYIYNPDGTILSETSSDSDKKTYTYTDDGKIKTIADRLDNITAFQYDENNRVKQKTTPTGVEIYYTYRNDGKLTEKNVDDINHTQYSYNGRGLLEQVKQVESGADVKYYYDTRGFLKSAVNALGHKTHYEYTARGQLAHKYLEDRRIESYSYNSRGLITSKTDERNNTTNYFYDSHNRLTKVKYPLGYTEQFEYNSAGQMSTYIDKNNNEWKYTYKKNGRPEKVIDPDDHYSETTYNAQGQIVSVSNFNGQTTSYEYDPQGRIIKAIPPSLDAISYGYDLDNNSMSHTNARGYTQDYLYDRFGRLGEIQSPDNRVVGYGYNKYNQIVNVSAAQDDSIRYDYDNMGRMTKATDADGVWQEYSYDANGNVIFHGDSLGRGVSYEYDNRNRLLSVANTHGERMRYEYNDKENSITVVNGTGIGYSYYFDAMNRMVREINRLGKEQIYAYDSNGNMTYKRRFDGEEIYYQFDKRNNLTKITYPDGNVKSYTYDLNSNLVSAAGNDSELEFEYDEMNRMTAYRDIIHTKEVSYAYDQAGNRTSLSWYNGQRTSHYTYGKNNELTSVTDHEGNVITIEYDNHGREIQRVHPGDCVTEKSYTAAGRLLFVKNTSQQPDQLLPSYGYVYNQAGDIQLRVDETGAIRRYDYDLAGRIEKVNYPAYGGRKKEVDMQERLRLGLNSVDRTNTYGLQLPSELEDLPLESGELSALNDVFAMIKDPQALLQDQSPVWTESFHYDKAGNRSFKVNYNGVIVYDYDASGALLHAGKRIYSYDAQGNLSRERLNEKQAVYSYNYDDRVTRIETNAPDFLSWSKATYALGMEYTYDVLDRRSARYHYEHNGIGSANRVYNHEDALHFLYDGQSLDVLADLFDADMEAQGIHHIQNHHLYPKAEYLKTNSQLVSRTCFESFRTGETADNVQSYFHQDIRGSVMLTTENLGMVQNLYDYDTFGNPTKDDFNTMNEFGYIGKRYDISAGSYNLGFRDYNPMTGGFFTIDPMRDGENWYQYCYADPVNLLDSNGLESQTTTGPAVPGLVIYDYIYNKEEFVLTEGFSGGFNTIHVGQVGTGAYFIPKANINKPVFVTAFFARNTNIPFIQDIARDYLETNSKEYGIYVDPSAGAGFGATAGATGQWGYYSCKEAFEGQYQSVGGSGGPFILTAGGDYIFNNKGWGINVNLGVSASVIPVEGHFNYLGYTVLLPIKEDPEKEEQTKKIVPISHGEYDKNWEHLPLDVRLAIIENEKEASYQSKVEYYNNLYKTEEQKAQDAIKRKQQMYYDLYGNS